MAGNCCNFARKRGGRRRSLAGCIALDTATGLQAVTAPEAAGTRASAAGAAHEAETVLFGPFSFRTRLLEDGVPVKLGGDGQPHILRLLLSRAGEVVPKNEILSYAWSGLAVEEISLRVHVAELRKVLGDGKDGARYITNVPSRGYCFVAPVQRGEPTPLRHRVACT